MQTIEFIDPVSVILSNIESLPQPKFNVFDWVSWRDTPVQYRDKGIVTGFFYEAVNDEEVIITYRIVIDKRSPSYYQAVIECDFATEDELEKLDEVSIAKLMETYDQ